MRASELDFSKIRWFSRSEWPKGTLFRMDERILLGLFDIREIADSEMHPSPVYQAHVRNETSSSRHSLLQGERLSDATDFFCRWEDSPQIARAIIDHRDLRGYGFYTDMRYSRESSTRYGMFHIDTRPRGPVCWIGEGREPVRYVYLTPSQLLQEIINRVEETVL